MTVDNVRILAGQPWTYMVAAMANVAHLSCVGRCLMSCVRGGSETSLANEHGNGRIEAILIEVMTSVIDDALFDGILRTARQSCHICDYSPFGYIKENYVAVFTECALELAFTFSDSILSLARRLDGVGANSPRFPSDLSRMKEEEDYKSESSMNSKFRVGLVDAVVPYLIQFAAESSAGTLLIRDVAATCVGSTRGATQEGPILLETFPAEKTSLCENGCRYIFENIATSLFLSVIEKVLDTLVDNVEVVKLLLA
ncbi:hypothetical protein Tco_0550531 [Tanacetum coccineum]